MQIDISIDDVLCGLDKWERKDLFQGLLEDYGDREDFQEIMKKYYKSQPSATDEYIQALQDLRHNQQFMTLEQQQKVIDLSKEPLV